MRAGPGHVVALLACALFAPPAHAAGRARSTFGLRESFSQRFERRGRGAERTYEIRDARNVNAKLALATTSATTAILDGTSRVFLQVGALQLDARLSDDPRWIYGRRSAKFALRAQGAAPQDPPVGSVAVKWTRSRVTLRVRASGEAYLGDLAPPAGASKLSMPADGTAGFGGAWWFFAGTAKGTARVTHTTVLGTPYDLVAAKVALAGTETPDPRVPTLTIDTPRAGGLTLVTPVRVTGTSLDARGVDRVLWSLDGGAETDAAFATDVPGDPPGWTRATFAFDAPVAAEGPHVLHVRVIDPSGAETSKDVAFTYVAPKRDQLLATGQNNSFVVRDGVFFSWGRDYEGQLGDDRAFHMMPTAVATPSPAVSVSAGLTHTVVAFEDGTVAAAGANGSGQLGDGTTTDHWGLEPVQGLTGILRVASGPAHNVALRDDGTVWCWGINSRNACGEGASGVNQLVPVQVPGITDAVSVAAGFDMSYAILADGTALAWGEGRYGQLGSGDRKPTAAPVVVGSSLPGGLGDVVAIAASSHTLALLSDGTVWVWGAEISYTPRPVQGVSGAVSAAVGSDAYAVLLADGTVSTWGGNHNGQLGDGTNMTRLTPLVLPGLSNVVRIASSVASYHFIAQQDDGTLLGWGLYTVGDPGSGSGSWTPTPIELP